MANRYVRTAGGNYSVAATWASTSGGTDTVTVPTSADDVFLDANSGQLTIDATSAAKSFNCTGYTGILTHLSFLLTVAGSITFSATMTYVSNNSSVELLAMNAIATLTTNGILLRNFGINSGQTCTLGDNLSFAPHSSYRAFIRVGGVSSATLNMNGKTINGYSTIDRILIRSGTVGVASTIINATTGFTNADFRDITFSSVSNLDLSTITGLSGDCGGNSITGGGTVLTFTAATTQICTMSANQNWSTAGIWTSRVPLPQDNVSMTNVTGGVLTVNMPRIGKNISWIGATGTPTFSITSIPITIYGSLTLISGITLDHSQTITFEGRGAFTLTSAGKLFSTIGGDLIISMVGGTLTLMDAYSTVATANTFFNLLDGTFNTAGFNFTCGRLIVSNSTRTRSLNITNSLVTLVGSNTTSHVWTLTTLTGFTGLFTGSTISIANISATDKTFDGGGLTYNNIAITGGGTGVVIFTGANIFNRLTVNGGTKSITLPEATTTTLLSDKNLNNGTNIITFTSSAGSATISIAAGVVSWNYVNLTNIVAAGGATFYAGKNSVDGGGNTGWQFISPYSNRRTGRGVIR